MGMFDAINASASGMTAERARIDVVSENLANANSSRGVNGQPYRRKEVVLQTAPAGGFGGALAAARTQMAQGSAQPAGVKVAAIVQDGGPGRRQYDPSNPDADAQGYVTYPNVNPVNEMVDLISASRSYEANATAATTSKNIFSRTLDVLK